MIFTIGVVAAFCALVLLNLLLLLTVFTDTLKLWPTPHKNSWQSYTFWPLFRTGLGLTIMLGIWQFATASSHGVETLIGLPIALAWLAITIYGYFDLGIENTYGADEGLITSGLYSYSRNPQYVASILGFAGLAIAVSTPAITLLCTLAICVYSLLPFAEEPWLTDAYGDKYKDYKRRTPRFFNVFQALNKQSLVRQ